MIKLETSDIKIELLENGDIYRILSKENIMINQLNGNIIDGSLNNLYLRVYRNNEIIATPLLGNKSSSIFKKGKNSCSFEGSFETVQYNVILKLKNNCWFWEVNLSSNEKIEYDIIYTQDLGMGNEAAVKTNEAYTCQYLGHKVFNENGNYIICSRQNMPQGKLNSFIQQGCLDKAVSFSTDGFQFFGKNYRDTEEIEVLKNEELANINYQYEFAFIALKTEKNILDKKDRKVFYSFFLADYPDAIKEYENLDKIKNIYKEIETEKDLEKVEYKKLFDFSLYKSENLSEDKIINNFNNVRHKEYYNGNLVSFFYDKGQHVVLKEKDLAVERAHGHILMSGNNNFYRKDVIASTSYMFGVFNSQTSSGNTSFNILHTINRNSLNFGKITGQRIFVKRGKKYEILAEPSLFEMGTNYCKWTYAGKEETITVTNYILCKEAEINLVIESSKPLEFMITNNFMEINNFDIEVKSLNEVFLKRRKSNFHEEINYTILLSKNLKSINQLSTVSNLEKDLMILETNPSEKIRLRLIAGKVSNKIVEFKDAVKEYHDFHNMLKRNFSMKLEGNKNIEKLNDLVYWYIHNALVHYSVPHGLEQFSGAAWGTRDVCQGPFELFLSFRRYEEAREILKTVYSHQYSDIGNWPQWFMFDSYYKVQQEDSHGDVIVWPLRSLCYYLKTTKDFSILNEKLPFMNRENFEYTKEQFTLLDHIKLQYKYIKDNFIKGTYLPCYGDGDWDDTLQPANADLKSNMVSGWTTALTYETLVELNNILLEISEIDFAKEIVKTIENLKKDYEKYIVINGITTGFVYLKDLDRPEYIIHPTDNKTGINYRALPMLRGIISNIFTPEEAKKHYEIVKKELLFEDGLRLMSKPASYTGGVSKYFKRAEQSACFGREIGLQYVHAHIRYIEAMSKIGDKDGVYKGLMTINPIGITENIKNAEIRQSNAYFSSSDGMFNDRYEAEKGYLTLKNGETKVKGGWRIYSSGPGIYINQLISNFLGLREERGEYVFDSVIPEELSGLEVVYNTNEIPVKYVFKKGKIKKLLINGKEIMTEKYKNKYKEYGIKIKKDIFDKELKDENIVEIYF